LRKNENIVNQTVESITKQVNKETATINDVHEATGKRCVWQMISSTGFRRKSASRAGHFLNVQSGNTFSVPQAKAKKCRTKNNL